MSDWLQHHGLFALMLVIVGVVVLFYIAGYVSVDYVTSGQSGGPVHGP